MKSKLLGNTIGLGVARGARRIMASYIDISLVANMRLTGRFSAEAQCHA